MGIRGAAIAVLVVGCAPAIAHARTPLPTLEVVPPEQKRVRLLDLRWATQVGYGVSITRRASVLTLGTEAHVSFVEITKAAQLHAALGVSGMVDSRHGWQSRASLFGVDAGFGLSHHAPGGPALVATATVGPRWATDRAAPDIQVSPEGTTLRVDGWGVVGRIDAYPFYLTIPEILHEDRKWFREYVASGLHVWVTARYDVLSSSRGLAIAGGLGLDLGRMLLTPIVVRSMRGRSDHG